MLCTLHTPTYIDSSQKEMTSSEFGNYKMGKLLGICSLGEIFLRLGRGGVPKFIRFATQTRMLTEGT